MTYSRGSRDSFLLQFGSHDKLKYVIEKTSKSINLRRAEK